MSDSAHAWRHRSRRCAARPAVLVGRFWQACRHLLVRLGLNPPEGYSE